MACLSKSSYMKKGSLNRTRFVYKRCISLTKMASGVQNWRFVYKYAVFNLQTSISPYKLASRITTQLQDIVSGFQTGADDYVVKPFDLVVLYSRIQALLRRVNKEEINYFCDDITMDIEKTTVFCQQKEVVLSQPEFQILRLLMENKGKTITRRQLLEQIWDSNGNYVNDNTLTVTIKRLREKLHNPSCLKTIRSFGYRLEDTI